MKRYIVDIKAKEILSLVTLDAHTELSSDKTITDEVLEYSHLPFISVVLTKEQLQLLDKHNITYNEELIKEDNVCLAENTGYEKLRSYWIKTQRKALTGAGCKVGHLDSGCMIGVVPFEFGYNFIDNNTNVTDVYGHGTITASIIKHPIIATAPGCELHVLKVLTDSGGTNESAMLAAINYAVANNLDVINVSWQFSTPALDAAFISLAAGNCIVSAAAGNSSTDAYTTTPACLPGVVAVNAADFNGNPAYRNILVNPGIVGAHGITIACNGISCQSYNSAGNYAGCWGTSCSAPFFTGVFAMYKEQLGISNNKKILEYILAQAVKYNTSDYYGVGLPQF